MNIMTRQELLKTLTEHILSIPKDAPVLVGISGVDGVGKTRFAQLLCEELQRSKRPIIEASIDGFHFPKEVRYQKGENSPEGFYYDSFDNEAVKRLLLDPLYSGDRRYKKAIFDWETDQPVDSGTEVAPNDAILVMEGIFLFRPELVPYWDLKIYIDADFEVSLQRNVERTLRNGTSKTRAELEQKARTRYIPGQQLYFDEAKPKEVADIVIDNNDYERPFILKLNSQ